MRYEILNKAKKVINVIVADAAFVEAHYPGNYRLISGEEEAAEPLPAPSPPTKEELLAQLQALQAQITALGE